MSNTRDDDPMTRALCRTEGNPSDWDDDLYDQPETRKQAAARHERAKQVCARCPVQLECAERCDIDKDSGIWFGIHLEAWRKEQARLAKAAQQNKPVDTFTTEKRSA